MNYSLLPLSYDTKYLQIFAGGDGGKGGISGVVMNTTSFLFQALKKAGLIPGADMTFEAGLTKISYLLGREDLTLEQKKLVSLPCLKASIAFHWQESYIWEYGNSIPQNTQCMW